MDTIKKHESQKKDVKSYGLSASLMTGIWCFDGSVGIVFDHKGNIALQNTKGVGIGSGTPSISGGFFKSQYWTDDFKKLTLFNIMAIYIQELLKLQHNYF